MKRAEIFYFTLQDEQTKEEKLEWFRQTQFEQIPFVHVTPDQKSNWINLIADDYENFLLLIDKSIKDKESCRAIFETFSRGVETGRDEWVYDFSKDRLSKKVAFFIDSYNQSVVNQEYDFRIKWNSSLRTHAENKKCLDYQDSLIVGSAWRPFTNKYFMEKSF